MKIIIPQGQKQIIVDALNHYLVSRKSLKLDEEDNDYVGFDLLSLIGIMEGDYSVSVELTSDQKESFVHRHGVDFPEYNTEEEVIQTFEYIVSHVEDNELSFDVRSNVEFIGSEKENTMWYCYNIITPTQSKVIEGTPYVIISTRNGWNILENGIEIEEIANI